MFSDDYLNGLQVNGFGCQMAVFIKWEYLMSGSPMVVLICTQRKRLRSFYLSKQFIQNGATSFNSPPDNCLLLFQILLPIFTAQATFLHASMLPAAIGTPAAAATPAEDGDTAAPQQPPQPMA